MGDEEEDPRCWRERELDEACSDILKAEFVAVDLEFTGLFMEFQKHATVEQYYEYCADNVWKFAAVQLGVCAAYRDPARPSEWILCPYNFHIWPSRRRVFLSDSSSLSYLVQAGLDFNDWIRNGFDCYRLAAIERFEKETSAAQKIAPVSPKARKKSLPVNIRSLGLQRLFELIIEKEKPLVTHNGLLDMMHIYDKFVADVRTIQTVSSFRKEVLKLFSGGLYDTKYIANHGRTLKFRLSTQQHTNLEHVRSHLLRMDTAQTFKLSAARQAVMKDYSLLPLGPGQLEHTKAHEAGFDAMATAQTFALELEKYVAPGGAIPAAWTADEHVTEVAFVLDLCVSPGRLDMRSQSSGSGPASEASYQSPSTYHMKRNREDDSSSPAKRPCP
ncbi:MAG: uncharacterized protein KVP18_001004 [Porospora cf. gigantea A]|uniref:uncharacterized protein n=1 Tax=Porospora cf. gigantea A TaxID=2853593 RepID=UPI003559A53A|nr:MAG: hypothetical protein KVP18_001004 [Porospora cf. gigantea A]